MSSSIGRRWFRRSGLALAALLSLGALAATSQPADARVWIGFGIPFGYYYAPPPPPVYAYPAYYGWGWRHARWCRWHPYAPSCHYW